MNHAIADLVKSLSNAMADCSEVSAGQQPVYVVVGVIMRALKVLIAKRKPYQHQGNLWEFPGGKLNLGESVRSALLRELHEELGIKVLECKPLTQIHHDYSDKSVVLDVWMVTLFSGEPEGREGQQITWVEPSALSELPFPAANQAIISMLI